MIVHRPNTSKRVVKHRLNPWRFGYALCGTCGLLWLKNAVSQRAAMANCTDWEED